jgi:hypothetical protein
MTQSLRKFNAQPPPNDQEPDATQQTSSTDIDNCSGDAPTSDYETIPNEIQVTPITVDRRDVLVAQ